MLDRIVLALAALAALAAACSKEDPLYCDEDTPCDDPALSFCDLGGDYPASEGIDHTCIAEPSFAISLSDDDAQVRIGGTLDLEVTIDRTDGFPGDIAVTAADLPAGTSADPLTIPEGVTSGTLTIQGGDADPGALAAASVTATAGPFERAADLSLLVLGPAGSLDPTFGTLGVAGQPDLSGMDDATLLMQLADGGFIVGGPHTGSTPTAVLVRFGADGVADSSFGPDGWTEVDLAGTDAGVQGSIRLADHPDDKIVLAQGSDTGDVVLVRLNRDAERDGTFGSGGIIAEQVAAGVFLAVGAVAVGPNGEIVVGITANSADLVYVVRFTGDGVQDEAFASDGRLEIDRGTSHALGKSYVFADGSMLVTGSAVDGGGTRVPFRLRYTSTGTLDSDFGDGGELVLPAGWSISEILPDAEGRWLVGGSIDGTPALFRLTEMGQVDATFGTDGAIIVPVPAGRAGSIRSLVPGDGDIIAVGSPDVLMTRLEEDAIDASFGTDGVAMFELENLFAVRAVRRADGRVVVLADNDSLPFVVARFFD